MATRRRVVWTPEARRTLEEVLAHIASESPQGAAEVVRQALAAVASLETLAERGRIVPEHGEPSIREIFVDGGTAVSEKLAQATTDGIEILRHRYVGDDPHRQASVDGTSSRDRPLSQRRPLPRG